ncbi:hypothetical protein ACQ3I4_09205 [Zafaria sp. Z1313]|uniref:hypothetical protein n=1 Tax=unclassified Zafaria TaxID=2828765 RepID=UPI002E7A5354|nr:hypothetical protein [Zafaria sp. J156]MEE1621914.1 hypothetical protein [Zafaria sp. J156]
MASPSTAREFSLPRHSERATRQLVALLVLAAVALWAVTVYLSTAVDVSAAARTVALALHVLALVASFGSVLMVDWHGMLWLLGRRELFETIRLDSAASPLIWGGVGVMMVTGVFLEPDLASALTLTKLAAVLVLTVNGIMLIPLMRRLVKMPARTSFSSLPIGQRIHMVVCAGISQAAWWTAIVVGFVNVAD